MKQAALFLAAALMLTAAEGEREREVRLEDVPEAARKTILRESGGHEIVEVEEVTSGGRTFYEAEWLDQGREVEVAVTVDGEVIGREVEAAEGADDDGEDDDGGDGEDGDGKREDGRRARDGG
jgi:hypothetical protein